ncbi:hypothetical protein [Roseomonas marmotae]|uniref:Uncharacterized protein n=1 Tax=Roseomonas marmotae TaxID=2768161 RepID=A0ABS3K9C9_9PROT|nr:hypothetical protein [Roseomonas marmotae]MBO1074066.1 hypothetical protein [Roseomonas marmotae]QTI78851.1 hypothetical protein IAI58_14515 [Roseomonas marmotae]
MFLFLITALVLLGLLVAIPVWMGTEFDQMPFATIGVLVIGVLLSAIWGRTPKE